MPYVISDDTPVVPQQGSGAGFVLSDDPDAPQRGVLDRLKDALGGAGDLARGTGLTARAAVNGLVGLPGILARPINSVLGLGDPMQALDALMTKAGLPEPQTGAERIASGAVSAATGAGGVARTAAALPGKVAEILAARPGLQMAAGAASGAAGQGAHEAGLSPASQLAVALAAGFAVPAAADTAAVAVPGAVRFARAAAEPFTEAGQRQIVGATLNRLAQNPTRAVQNMAALGGEIIPGSTPSTAQASRDIGLAGLERALSPADLALQESQNNAARVAAFTKVARTKPILDATIAARAAVADRDYSAAAQTPIAFSPQDTRQLAEMSTRPAFQAAMKRASDVAADMGMPPQQQQLNNPDYLHLIKLGLDQSIESAKTDNSIGKFGMRGILNTRDEFLDMLDRLNPAYAKARARFQAASGPIDKMQALQEAFQNSQLAASDSQTGVPVLSQAKFKNNVLNQLDDIKGLTAKDRFMLSAIGMDLDRAAVSNAGKAVGSNTVQNLGTKNAVGQTFGADLSNHPLLANLLRPLTYAAKASEPQIQDLLKQALVDPSLARRLMSGARPMTLGDLVPYGSRLRAYALGDVTGTAQQP